MNCQYGGAGGGSRDVTPGSVAGLALAIQGSHQVSCTVGSYLGLLLPEPLPPNSLGFPASACVGGAVAAWPHVSLLISFFHSGKNRDPLLCPGMLREKM